VTLRERETATSAATASADVTSLQTQVRELEASLGRAAVRVGKLETRLAHAQAQVAWFQRVLFGQKRERVDAKLLEKQWRTYLEEQEAAARGGAPSPLPRGADPLQLLMMLGAKALEAARPATAEEALARTGVMADANTAEAATADAAKDAAPATPPSGEPAPTRRRHAHGRTKLPGTLRTEVVELDADLGAFADDARLKDVEISYRVGVRPAEVFAIELHRRRHTVELANGHTRTEVAPPPAEMIERGLFAPSALAHIVAMKWERHVPYHRTALFFAKHGYELSKSTLSGVSIRAEVLARTLVTAMIEHAKTVAPYLAIDATGAKVQAPERATNGHTWMRFVEDVGVFVSFTAKHDASVASGLLDGWTCPFLADGAAVFNDFERRGGERFGCYAHARRKFFYAIASDPRGMVGVRLINDLFEIERAHVASGAEKRLTARQERSAPLVEKLVAWCRGLLEDSSVPPRSLLAKASRYVLNQEPRLRRFLVNGRVPIHNNLVELQMRHFAVGRKNWLFYGSERGANAGSTWLTLVLSARMHGLHVETYLRKLFRVLPSWPMSRILELAPHAWAETRLRLDPRQLAADYGPLVIPPRAAG
jgi:transposase